MKTLWNREACCLIECDWNVRSAKRWSLSLYSISEPRCLGLDGTPLLFDKPHWGSSGLLRENTGLYNRSLRHARHLFETCLDLLGERRGWCNVILSKFLVEKLLIHRLYPILLSTYYGWYLEVFTIDVWPFDLLCLMFDVWHLTLTSDVWSSTFNIWRSTLTCNF